MVPEQLCTSVTPPSPRECPRTGVRSSHPWLAAVTRCCRRTTSRILHSASLPVPPLFIILPPLPLPIPPGLLVYFLFLFPAPAPVPASPPAPAQASWLCEELQSLGRRLTEAGQVRRTLHHVLDTSIKSLCDVFLTWHVRR